MDLWNHSLGRGNGAAVWRWEEENMKMQGFGFVDGMRRTDGGVQITLTVPLNSWISMPLELGAAVQLDRPTVGEKERRKRG